MVSIRKNETKEDFIIRRKKYDEMRKKGHETNRGKSDPGNYWPNGKPRRKYPWCPECKKQVLKEDWEKFTTTRAPMKMAACGFCRTKLNWSIRIRNGKK